MTAPQTFVGREHELAELYSILERALDGTGQVAFVAGEAGSGKTSLVREFLRVAESAHANLSFAVGECNAQTGIGDPYLPFREILSLLSGDVETQVARGAISKENANRLRGLVQISLTALVEGAPELIGTFIPGAKLIAIAGKFLAKRAGLLKSLEEKSGKSAVGGIDQNQLFEQYTTMIKTVAAKQPLILVLDDLHWSDAGSASLLFHLGRRITDSRVMIVGAYRPEEIALPRGNERHPMEKVIAEFKRYSGDSVIDLSQAAASDGREFVNAYVDSEPNVLDDRFRAALFNHTGGHALFTVELLGAMQERGDLKKDGQGRWGASGALDWAKLPTRVEGVIEERVGRLTNELRDTLRVASVEGADFTAQVIARVQQARERKLVQQLSEELDRRHRLIREGAEMTIGDRVLSRFQFSHALIQQYIYNDLGTAERRLLHGEIAQVLEELYAGATDQVAVQLTRHFQEAGQPNKAIEYLKRSGDVATRISANVEAITHYTRAIELLMTQPESRERDERELDLQNALGVPLLSSQGFGSEELRRARGRAFELCQRTCVSAKLAPAAMGLASYYFVRSEYAPALEIAEKIWNAGAQTGDKLMTMLGYWGKAYYSFWMGKFAESRPHFEQVLALYDPVGHRSMTYVLGQDAGVYCYGWLGLELLMMGYADQSLQHSNQSIELARSLEHSFELATALYFSSIAQTDRRDFRQIERSAQEISSLGSTVGIHQLNVVIMNAFAKCDAGDYEGLTQAEDALHILVDQIGMKMARLHYVPRLAECHLKTGRLDQADAMIAQYLSDTSQTGEQNYHADIYRVQGELRLKQEREDEAEASFQKAIAIAQSQRAKFWELRATVALARMWQAQGKREAAREHLTAVYNWFTEGFDLPDMQEAKQLLQEL